MGNKTSKYILIDASFVGRMRQLDSTCNLIDYLGPCADEAICLITQQYQETPCNNYNPDCRRFESVFTDEDAIMEGMMANDLNKDLSKISRDPVDIKIFLWARTTVNTMVYTCDKNLLEICCKYHIERLCFKAAIKELDEWLSGAILNENDYNVNIFIESDDPFINFRIDTRCKSHCHNSPCACFNPFSHTPGTLNN
ncbi:hypothetical protein [Desulfocicer niacini]